MKLSKLNFLLDYFKIVKNNILNYIFIAFTIIATKWLTQFYLFDFQLQLGKYKRNYSIYLLFRKTCQKFVWHLHQVYLGSIHSTSTTPIPDLDLSYLCTELFTPENISWLTFLSFMKSTRQIETMPSSGSTIIWRVKSRYRK